MSTFKRHQLSVPGKPPLPSSLPLIIPDDCEYDSINNKLVQKENAKRTKLVPVDVSLSILRAIKKPLAVLSICGPYRTGKSYILSRVLGSSNAFELGHQMHACTFGIWMGTTVLEFKDYVLLLLDTEGIDAVSASGTDDARVLVITILLSSFVVYNSQRVPTKTDLEKMRCFTQLTESIQVRKGEENNDLTELRDYFPDFMWLLRDVSLTPTDKKGNTLTPKDFLLTQVLKSSGKIRQTESDIVATSLLSFFRSIDCMMLPTPSADQKVMQNIATSESKLSPEFNSGVEKVISHLQKSVKPKRGYNSATKVNGDLMVSLMEQYIAAVNDPKTVPCLDNTWETVVAMKIEGVMKSLTEEYETEMENATKGNLPMEEDKNETTKAPTILAIHRSILSAKKKALIVQVGHLMPHEGGDAAECLKQREKILQEFTKRIAEYKEEEIKCENGSAACKVVKGGILFKFTTSNYKCSYDHCIQLFERLFKQIDKKLKSKSSKDQKKYTFEDLQRDLQYLHSQYKEQAVGPAKWKVFSEKQQELTKMKEVFKQLEGFQQELFETSKKAAQLAVETEEFKQKAASLQAKMEQDKLDNQQMLDRIDEEHKQAIERLKEESDIRLKEESEKMEEMLKANMEEAAKLSEEKLEAMQQEYAEKLSQCEQARMDDMNDYKERIRESMTPCARPPPTQTRIVPMPCVIQ